MGNWMAEDELEWRSRQNKRAGQSISLAPYRCPNCDHELIVDYGTLDGDTFTPKKVLDNTGVEERPFVPDSLGYGTNVFPAWIAAIGTHQLQIAYAKLEKEVREIRRTRLGRLAWWFHGGQAENERTRRGGVDDN